MTKENIRIIKEKIKQLNFNFQDGALVSDAAFSQMPSIQSEQIEFACRINSAQGLLIGLKEKFIFVEKGIFMVLATPFQTVNYVDITDVVVKSKFTCDKITLILSLKELSFEIDRKETEYLIKNIKNKIEIVENNFLASAEISTQLQNHTQNRKSSFCPNCGKMVTGNFCSSCGADVNGATKSSAILRANGVEIDLREIKRIAQETNQAHALAQVQKMTGLKDGKEIKKCIQLALQYQEPEEIEKIERLEKEGVPMCPKCHSTHLSANKKGFSLGKATAGLVLVGSIGLVGGMFGRNKIKLTCLNCGYKFDIQKK